MFEIKFKNGKIIMEEKEWRVTGWFALGNVESVKKLRRQTKRTADLGYCPRPKYCLRMKKSSARRAVSKPTPSR